MGAEHQPTPSTLVIRWGRRVTAWGHAVEGFAIGRVDAAGNLPRQRHSTIGSVGTVPTVPLRALRGPGMVYAEATTALPLLAAYAYHRRGWADRDGRQLSAMFDQVER